MIKKSLVSIVILYLLMFMLASCAASSPPNADKSTQEGSSDLSAKTNATETLSTTSAEEEKMIDKIRQIKPNWTIQQVYDLLGKPDRFGERSVVAEVFYTVNPSAEVGIAFWSDGIQITVINSETGEKTKIL